VKPRFSKISTGNGGFYVLFICALQHLCFPQEMVVVFIDTPEYTWQNIFENNQTLI